jgi:hypothetical protein
MGETGGLHFARLAQPFHKADRALRTQISFRLGASGKASVRLAPAINSRPYGAPVASLVSVVFDGAAAIAFQLVGMDMGHRFLPFRL